MGEQTTIKGIGQYINFTHVRLHFVLAQFKILSYHVSNQTSF